MTIFTRPARAGDARDMSHLLGEILSLWNSKRPNSPDHVLAHYINHPDRIACTVATNSEYILGFQSLKLAQPDNQYDVQPGWGIIGSYVRIGQAGAGIGRLLFEVTRVAAQNSGLAAIDATIGAGNEGGLAYYQALGFRTYVTTPGCIRKRYDLE